MKSERMLKTIGISSIPKGWEWKRIDECFDIIKRKNDNNSENILTISSLSGFVNQKERFSKVIAGDNLKKYTLLRKGEFSYNKGNSKTFPCGCIFLLEDYEEAAVPNVYISFKNKNEISNKFYRYYFQNRLLDGQLKRLINTGVRNDGLLNINTDEFCGVYILVPPIKEQEKISEILSTWDLSIEKQEQLIEKKKELKKGLMNRLLQSEFYIEYEKKVREVRLGDICRIKTGKLDANAMTEDGEYKFFTCAKDVFKIDKYAFDTEALLISGNGANVGYIHYYKGKFNAYQRTYVLDEFKEDILFIKFILEKNLATRINREKNSGNTPYIVLSTLSKMKIKIPSKETQLYISGLLQMVDKEIELLEKELEVLKLQKKGLMQRLLTGEVRVKV